MANLSVWAWERDAPGVFPFDNSEADAVNKPRVIAAFLMVVALVLVTATLNNPFARAEKSKKGIAGQGAYTGSQSCRRCHERFCKLWAPSHHGTAMQDYSEALAKSLAPQAEPVTIKGRIYLAQTGPGQGWLLEKAGGKETRLPIKYALGGKNIYYFLTPLERGRLQTLPLAYDIKGKKWFDTAMSGLRHAGDQPVDWRDPSYTFNTSCHGCHVSQYSLNYDLRSDTYRTTWREPGINCETCHGPGEEHIRVCTEAPQGTIPKDLKIIRGGRSFSHAQNNATCSSCHAKAVPLSQSFVPGNNFWDHYDLSTLEHPDYYPDGRDLGENYTYTSWLLSSCVKAGDLDCLHCHTSSGRFRQKKDSNRACLPCHAEQVDNAPAHTKHAPGTMGNQCISCHMPMTSFARMRRSDHSMLPPMPSATLRFGSPNACNDCHKDKDPTWADKQVRQWRKRDYQALYLHRAELIEAARKRDWTRLPEMVRYIESKERNEVFATSLLRLLRSCPEEIKWVAVLGAAKDPSPLVRAAALELLQDLPSAQAGRVLLAALDDDYRLARIRAAQSLASYPRRSLSPAGRKKLEKATREMLSSLLARPDTWSAHYNVGNFYLDRGQIRQALYAYGMALKLEPRVVMPMVNMAIAYARGGDNKNAKQMLNKALKLEPDNAAVNFNLGLLEAEMGHKAQAKKHLRAALKADPQMARAAYNLGLLLHQNHPKKAVELIHKAFEKSPNPRYAFTLAYYMNQAGDRAGAEKILVLSTKNWPWHADSYLLLADILAVGKEKAEAIEVLQKALKQGSLSPPDRRRLEHKLASLKRQTFK